MRSRRNSYLSVILLACISGLLNISCRQHTVIGNLIITQIPGDLTDITTVDSSSAHYMTGARIAAVDLHKPASIKILTDGFYSACSPDVSWDGERMLFAAQQNKNDIWQIWEMDLKHLKSRKVTSFKENCLDPAFLPNDRFVFSKYNTDGPFADSYTLYTCSPDGSEVTPISFHPRTNFATTVLQDGRLLTVSTRLFPWQENAMLMILRPDGTKAALFYKGTEGSDLLSKARESTNGIIWFIEADSGENKKRNVVSINYNRPLHSRLNITGEIPGNFGSVLPLSFDKVLVSYRKSDSEPYALYELDLINKKLGKKIFESKDYSVLEAVMAEKHTRPKKLPSEVDMAVKTGLLLCQDINFTSSGWAGNISSLPRASKIEVLGIDTTYGIVQVEKDGSFYLKVMADKPFRIQTLDESGKVINGPCSWIWLRPNERRGCIGCHEDQELAPENIVPMSVRKDPVIIPVHRTEVAEKEVELE